MHARDLLWVSMESNVDNSNLDVDDGTLEQIIISPPSPITPLIILDIFDSESELDSQDSDDMDIQDHNEPSAIS